MRKWTLTKNVFNGGTESVKKLAGKKVRTIVPLCLNVYNPNPVNSKDVDKTFKISTGQTGFIANPNPVDLSQVLVAFSINANNEAITLEKLKNSGSFIVITTNWPTLQHHFEIEES